MKKNMTPATRADLLRAALLTIYPEAGDDAAHLMTHALSDMRHLADASGEDFAASDRTAYTIYLREAAA